MIGQQLDQITD